MVHPYVHDPLTPGVGFSTIACGAAVVAVLSSNLFLSIIFLAIAEFFLWGTGAPVCLSEQLSVRVTA